MKVHLRALLPICLLALLALAPASALAADRTVEMRDILFAPSSVEIRAGDRVTWINRDPVPHDATGSGWATPLLADGESASVRFTAAGTYAYICSVHPEMTGSVVVRPGVATGGGAGTVTHPPTDAAPGEAPAEWGRPDGGSWLSAVIIVTATVGWGAAAVVLLGSRAR